MYEVKAVLKSRQKLVGKGKDCRNNYTVKVDLGKLSNLLEKEGLMSKDLGEMVISLKDYSSLKIFPISGTYFPHLRRIDIYLFKDRGWYRILKFLGHPMTLNRKEITRTLAHEIYHAIRDLKIEKKFKSELWSMAILGIIDAFSNLIYPISPLEILARRFGKCKARNPEWLRCIEIKKIKN
ncbi:hypothetical protein J7K42_02775 [bacterium]|nr:hypothetical protein [bacterium]